MKRKLGTHFGCATEFTLDVLGGKWTTVILCYLRSGQFRYGELRRMMPKLSDKVLSERLSDLQRVGLVMRVPAGQRSSMAYRLSPRGRSLGDLLSAIYAWGTENASAYGVKCDNPLDTIKRSRAGR